MKTKTQYTNILMAAVLTVALGACKPGEDSGGNGASTSDADQPAGEVDQEVVITANDQMKYNIESFEVEAGSTVRLVLENVGSMPKASMGHNVVVLESDADPLEFANAASTEAANDYIPQDKTSEIIAHTKMLGGGEEDEIVFNVPSSTGDYPFLCSFPGHIQAGMEGTMEVR
ncbi:MAG: plastocyanin/azurin family copper-binding protein [Opitutales bacterium]